MKVNVELDLSDPDDARVFNLWFFQIREAAPQSAEVLAAEPQAPEVPPPTPDPEPVPTLEDLKELINQANNLNRQETYKTIETFRSDYGIKQLSDATEQDRVYLALKLNQVLDHFSVDSF